jgi:uncharacterized protein (TIGR00730 family)
MLNKIKRIAVFCGARKGSKPNYLEEAGQFASALVEANIGLVYGGSKVGLMGAIADRVLALGGEAIGVIPAKLVEKEIAHPRLSQLHVVDTMQQRKSLIEDLSDGFVMLPGGSGTLDEFFEVETLSQLGFHKKPCGMLNIANYFDYLLQFLKHSIKEGFFEQVYFDNLVVEKNPHMLLERFQHYTAPTTRRYDKVKEEEIA